MFNVGATAGRPHVALNPDDVQPERGRPPVAPTGFGTPFFIHHKKYAGHVTMQALTKTAGTAPTVPALS
jgi:hypothetical protein